MTRNNSTPTYSRIQSPGWAQQSSTSGSKELVLARRPRHSLDTNNAALQCMKRASSKRLMNSDYAIGWVATLSIERAAAEAMLDEKHQKLPKQPGDPNTYSFGEIGGHNVVIASLGDYGTINAATVASNMHRTFPSIQVFLMVGIAGGAPKVDDVRLGDVVVSESLIQYDLGKALGENRFETTAAPLKPSQELRSAVDALKARHEAEPSRIPDILNHITEQNPRMERYTCREPLKDLLFESSYEHPETESNCGGCDRSRLEKREPRRNDEPMIHYGVVASGDQVIKYATTRDILSRRFKALCFEMEGAGFIESRQCLVIRSICDYADSHKNDLWHRYAAATAAAYTKELLGEMQVLESQASKIVVDETRNSDLMKLLFFESMSSREWNIERAHNKTCEWILQHPTYTAWLDPEKYHQTQGFLWIRGKPGAGKSTLMKFISMHVSKKYPTVVSFFFNARGDDLEKSVEGMYRSLLHQLLAKVPYLQLLDHPHLRLLASSSHFEWTIGILQELFSHAIARLGQCELICFIDALDECDASQVQRMVKHFGSLGSLALKNNLKLFICFSSRHYPAISIIFGLTFTLEDQDGHRRDLKEYVDQNLHIVEEDDAPEIKTALIQKSAGVFLWVVLVVRILNKDYLSGRLFGLSARLNEIPSKLHALFRGILQKDDNRADILLSMKWILYAKVPLTPEEYYYAMAAGLHPRKDPPAEWGRKKITPDKINRFVSSSSKGLAEVTKSYNPKVQFIHESVRDSLSKLITPDFEYRSHNRLKDCCYAYVKAQSLKKEKFNNGLIDLRSWGIDYSTKFPFLKYATANVLYHADMAADGVSQQDFLKTFDRESWIGLRNIFRSPLTDYDWTPSANIFYILAGQGHARLIDSAVSLFGPKVHVCGEKYRYPLFIALRKRHDEAVDAILKAGLPQLPPDCDTLVIDNDTPLTLAVSVGHVKMVELLLDQGLTPNTANPDGLTPLICAVSNRSLEMVQLLLDKGANINSRIPDGNTALIVAIRNQSQETVQLLLDKGANTNLKNQDGDTALIVAIRNKSLDAVWLLLDKGANTNLKNQDGDTALIVAIRNESLEAAQLLLDNGASINSKNKLGDTSLIVAIENKSLEAVRLLLDKGAKISSIYKSSNTLLMATIFRSPETTEIIQLLLARDVNVISKFDMTPLQLAVTSGFKALAPAKNLLGFWALLRWALSWGHKLNWVFHSLNRSDLVWVERIYQYRGSISRYSRPSGALLRASYTVKRATSNRTRTTQNRNTDRHGVLP